MRFVGLGGSNGIGLPPSPSHPSHPSSFSSPPCVRASSLPSSQLLPSASNALAFVRGERGAWLQVGRDIILRSAIAGVGLHLAGEREALVKKSLAVACSIEAVVLAIAYTKNAANGRNGHT